MHNNFERPYLSISKPKYNANADTLHRYSLENYKLGNQTNIQNETPQKSSFASKMCDKIKLMMEHVSKTVTRLLENLNYLYETNGIDYQVSQYYRTLMRLLTPHELLSHFHIQDNNQLFKGNEREKQKLIQCPFKSKYSLSNVRRKSTEQNFFLKQKNNIEKFNISSMNNELSMNSPIQSRLWLEKLPNEKYNGGKPILGSTAQKQLAKWVLQQLGMSKILKMKDIAAKTKQFAYKYRGFKCSIGWVNRFLYRHPYLKQMMKLAKQRKFEHVRQLYFKVKGALVKEANEDIKVFNSQIMGQYTYPQFTDHGQANKQNSQQCESYINSSAENHLSQSIQSEIQLKSETPSERKKQKQGQLQQELRYNYSDNEDNQTNNLNRYKVIDQSQDEKQKKQKKAKFQIKSFQQNNEENQNSMDNQQQEVFEREKFLSLKDQSGKNYHHLGKKNSKRDQAQNRRS